MVSAAGILLRVTSGCTFPPKLQVRQDLQIFAHPCSIRPNGAMTALIEKNEIEHMKTKLCNTSALQLNSLTIGRFNALAASKHSKDGSTLQRFNVLSVIIGLLCLLGGNIAMCQTNTAVPPQNFFQSVQQYFTSANTNFTWTNNTLECAIGADYMSSVNWANYLDAQYDVGKFGIEAKMRNAGIAGAVDSLQAGIEYTLIQYYSVKLEAGVIGGYDLERNSPIIEPKLTVRSKLTPNTFAGVVLSLPIWTTGRPMNNVPDIGVEAGFTY